MRYICRTVYPSGPLAAVVRASGSAVESFVSIVGDKTPFPARTRNAVSDIISIEFRSYLRVLIAVAYYACSGSGVLTHGQTTYTVCVYLRIYDFCIAILLCCHYDVTFFFYLYIYNYYRNILYYRVGRPNITVSCFWHHIVSLYEYYKFHNIMW